eukprot:TRINITY_DN10776_c0_g1_i1.p1 TRINITY_DN10776_c0_g1~~TRINITY_DN10776_c0_g1_i1.p1  ORF type:complete len:317 (+),score=47.12 TRINITY_DN10776_c0_g1_i1:70-1020(+)
MNNTAPPKRPPPPPPHRSSKDEQSSESEHSLPQPHVLKDVGVTLSSEEIIHKQFAFGVPLGHGSFSQVLSSENRLTGESCALKVIDKSLALRCNKDSLKLEVESLKKAAHPNIMKLYSIFETPKKVYLATELLSGGTLSDFINDCLYNEPQVHLILVQLSKAIAFLHSVGICHRDIKPDNLVFVSRDFRSLKLIDFGLSCFFESEAQLIYEWCGTTEYQAPEMIKGIGYNRQVDLWAIGVLAFLLFTGNLPFEDKNTFKLREKIIRSEIHFDQELWSRNFTSYALDMVKGLLNADPSQRLNSQQLLVHRWMIKPNQ